MTVHLKGVNSQILGRHPLFPVCVMIYKKGNWAEFGPVNVFQFKSDLVKPISCIRIKVIIIIISSAFLFVVQVKNSRK